MRFKSNEKFPKQLLLWMLVFLSEIAVAQTPSFKISPEGALSVCAGSNVSLNASLTNAFPGTTSYQVADIPFSPYAIPGGTVVPMNDDTIIGPLPIGFQFCFFGNTYTQFYLGSNGWIGFSPGQARSFVAMSVPYALPSPPNPGVPKNCIMGPWMDFNPKIAGGPYIRYQTQGSAPYRRLVVQWSSCPLYMCIALKATLQIVIFESTNIIENFITDKPTCYAWAGGTATQALHNQTGTVAVVVPGRNASVWTANNDGKRYTPNGPPGYTINWTANGFPIGTGNTVSHNVNAFTRLIGRVSFQCSNLTLSDTLDVNIGGTASAAFTVNGSSAATPPAVCAGQPVSLNYTGGGSGTAAWSLNGGNPAAGNGFPGQTVTYTTPGTYTIGLTITPSGGACSPGSSSKTISVIAAPAATMSLPASACINSTVNISYTGTVVAGGTYAWNFGSGASPATATGAGPHAVQWSTSGAKTVALSVTSGSCTATGSGNINISGSPAASFTVNPSSVCVGSATAITFNGSAPAGSTYVWNFGSGASTAVATGAGPFSISWSSAGSKTINLTVSSGGCSATSTQNLTVNALPSASFSLPADVCSGSTATANYTGSAGAPPAATYSWSLDGGTPSAGNVQGPLNISWTTPGVKTVGLTVIQNGCPAVTVTRSINVKPQPTVGITAASASQCTGQTTSFAISGSVPAAGSTYQWSFPGGNPASSNSAGPVNVSWPVAGAQTASLVVTSNGCSSQPAVANVSITNPAAASLNIPLSVCVGTPASISASGSFAPGTTFSWNFSGGTILSGSGQGPYSISWASTGNKSITLTTSLGNCTSTSAGSIQVETAPLVSISSLNSICENQPSTISFSGTVGSGAIYNWNFGSGASPATANTAGPHAITWSGGGNKTVSLTVTSGGCSGIGTQTLTVNPAFLPVISIPASICAGSSAAITSSSAALPGATYSWTFGSGASPANASGLGPHNVIWASGGSPVISLSVTSGGCTYAANAPLTVNPLPLSNFSLPATVCLGTGIQASVNPVAGTTYSWNFGAGANTVVAAGSGPHTVSWASTGSKTISLSATQNGCSSQSNSVILVNALPSALFSMPLTACSGDQVTIQYTGVASASAQFNWNFGAGSSPASATGIGPHQVSFQAGSRSVSLTVTENGCVSAPNIQNIIISNSPVADISLNSPACINAPVTATFTGTAGAGATFNWSYPGATLISGAGSGPVQISWTTGGIKTVSVSVSENGCSSVNAIAQITVNTPANFSLEAPAHAGTGVATTITYNGDRPAGATYNWNFDGGTVISGAGAGPYSVSWGSAGIKNIRCTVSIDGCEPVSKSIATAIVSGAVVAFSAQSPVCGNQVSKIQFTGLTFGNAAYAWDFDGGAIISGSGPGPFQISWSTPGIKTIRLGVTDLGITSAEFTAQVEVFAIPSADFSVTANICSGRVASVNYSGNAGSAATFLWDFGSGNAEGTAGRNNQVVFPAGNTAVRLSVSENGCNSLPKSMTLVIRPTPTATFSTASAICEGEAAELIYTGNGGVSASYAWSFNGADHISGSSPDPVIIRWKQPGDQRVNLQVALQGCVSDPFSLTVKVKLKPTSDFIFNTGNCSGDTVVLQYAGNATSAALYNWLFAGARQVSGSGAGPIKLVYETPGSHTIRLSVSEAGCSSGETDQSFTQYQSWPANFTVTDTIYISQRAQALYNGNLPASAAFSWRFPGGSLLNGSGPGPLELGYSETGTQKVFLQIDHQGCISPEVSREIVVLPIPSSRFFISNDSVCTGTLVWANYEGQVVPQAAYNWFFDGATVLSGTGAGPYQLDWNTSGLKRVRLEILINGQSSGVWEESVRVIEMPRAPFTLSNSVCAGSAVKPAFTGTQSNSNLFSWSFDGGDAQNTGTAEPSLSWSTPGLKTVTLSIADAMCISILESRSIMVYAIPEATFSAPEYVCPDAEAVIVFTGNAGNDADLNWNIGDAIGDQPSATEAFKLKWLSPGFRQLSLRVVENGCSSVVYTHQLDVKTKPVVNAGIDRLLCASDTISLQAEGNSGLSFKWEPSAGLSSDSVAHPLLSLQAIHNYVDTLFYKVMAADGFCTASDTLMVTLAPMPEAFIASPDPQCLEGNSFDFKAEGNFTNDATFSWNFGAHAYSHSPWEKNQQDIHFENAGEYPVSLIISQYGCTGKPFTRNVKINGHPKADFSIRPAKGCIPLNSTFTAHNGSAGNTYAWQFGDGSEGQGKQTGHVYAVSGYMSVVLTVSDSNGCKTTLKRPEAVEVLERPVAGFRVDPEMAYLGDKIDLTNLSHNTKYSYYIINNDTILGATSAYTFKEPGTHVITQVVVNAQGCEDEISHNVRIEHGSSLFIPSAFTPNNDGTNDLFRIEGTDLFQYNLIVFDRWGSEVFKSRDMKEGWNGYSASGEPLPEGVYGFILEARDKDNQNIHEVGQVTLIR